MLRKYDIGSNTLLLYAISKDETIVYECDDDLNVKEKSSKIIDNSCKFFGSSLAGRQEGTKDLIGVSIKSPIIIEETKEIIFFPTNSPRSDICSWVSYNNLLKYERIDASNTRLYFVNNRKLDLDVSYNIIDNQVTRCIKLERVLLKRKKAI